MSGFVARDACANLLENRCAPISEDVHGQRLNAAFSTVAALGVAAGVVWDMALAVGVFSALTLGSGLMQLAVALGRRRSIRDQGVMVLSGGQSALAGVFFIVSIATSSVDLDQVAPTRPSEDYTSYSPRRHDGSQA